MQYIRYEEKGKIAEIVLNRPDNYNALNEQMLRELENACVMAADSEALIVLCGEGRGFSAGGDIQMMTSDHDSGEYERLMKMIESITLTLYDMKNCDSRHPRSRGGARAEFRAVRRCGARRRKRPTRDEFHRHRIGSRRWRPLFINETRR